MKDEFLIQDLIFNINIGSAQTYNSLLHTICSNQMCGRLFTRGNSQKRISLGLSPK